MTNRFQFILTITAVLSFASAFIIDISQLGQDWSNFSKSIDITRLFTIILLNIVAGLFLGLFLFHKRPYKQRVLLTVPIAFILFSIANFGNIVIYEYGLFDEYNYFTAKRDIKNGKVQLLSTGLILPTQSEEEEKAEEAIRNQFGYKRVWIGCFVTPGVYRYNAVMEDYLEEINGKDWRKRLQQRTDSLPNSKQSH